MSGLWQRALARLVREPCRREKGRKLRVTAVEAEAAEQAVTDCEGRQAVHADGGGREAEDCRWVRERTQEGQSSVAKAL